MAQALRLRFSDVVDKFTDLGCWFLGRTTWKSVVCCASLWIFPQLLQPLDEAVDLYIIALLASSRQVLICFHLSFTSQFPCSLARPELLPRSCLTCLTRLTSPIRSRRFVSEFTFQVAYMYGGILVNLNYIKATEVKDAVSKSFRAVWPLYQLRRQLTHQSTFMEDAAAWSRSPPGWRKCGFRPKRWFAVCSPNHKSKRR